MSENAVIRQKAGFEQGSTADPAATSEKRRGEVKSVAERDRDTVIK